jgi:uncharacterized protein YbjT (DUF2867 family)
MKLFVYGGTGTVGRALIQHLLEAGHEILAGTRRPEQQISKNSAGRASAVIWVKVDTDAPQTLEHADERLSGVDSVFLMAPPGISDQYAILHPWIAAAKSAGVKKIVLMTAMGVENAPAEAPLRRLELALIASGVPYTILRPNWFMQNFFTFWLAGITADRKIYFPGGDAKTSFVDARDIARVASAVLDPHKFKNQEFAVTGPAALSHDSVAEIISEVTGIPIQYDDVAPDQFEAGLIDAGLPADYAAFLVQIAAALKAGRAAPVTSTVEDLTGDPARDFASFAHDYKSEWS